MENCKHITTEMHITVAALFLDCPQNKPTVLDTYCSYSVDEHEVLSRVNGYYGGASINNHDSEASSMDLFLYEKSEECIASFPLRLEPTERKDIEIVSAWHVNLQGGERRTVQFQVIHDENDFDRFQEWINKYYYALNCDLTTLDGIQEFARAMELPLRYNTGIDDSPIHQLYHELLQQFQCKYNWRVSPINENVQIFAVLYANLRSTVDMVNKQNYENGSLNENDEGYNEMLTSSTSKMKQSVMINWYITRPEIKIQEAIECCRAHSLRDLHHLEQKLVKVTCSIEELERFVTGLSQEIDKDRERRTPPNSKDSIEAWDKASIPPFFAKDSELAPGWGKFMIKPTLTEMIRLGEIIYRVLSINHTPPFIPTLQNLIRDSSLTPNRSKKMDPLEMSHFLILPPVAKIVFEAWYGNEWKDRYQEWKHIVQFLLHYHSSTLPLITRKEAHPITNVYHVLTTDTYDPNNFALTAALSIMYWIDAALALGFEKDLIQALTISEFRTRVNDRRFYWKTIGE